ncbi:MAG: mechanosensitive ion channel, partial [Jaaginema sp. PMC 1079.18]|nr:mechanosensitive ion channel [Jaaginema sp. PMC 1079.18]
FNNIKNIFLSTLIDVKIQQFLNSFVQVLNEPIITVAKTELSLLKIGYLIVAVILVVILSRALRNGLRNRLLMRMGIDAGNREVISTVFSYTVGTLTIILVLQSIGINMTSLAVVAGGLGVGIGLGLQNLTRNFASGLTLLLERQIKVGDFIEFDGLTGYVKAVSLRTTIIRTREGGDIIVPNENLIESRVLSWSYDGFLVGRIHLPVGVAYGSDPVLVTETLLQVAYMEPAVLPDPAPLVNFKGFGDNSLDFELRVWIEPVDKEPDIRSSLNYLIEYLFRLQNIQIPFPQRDLWLRNPEVLSTPRRQIKLENKAANTTEVPPWILSAKPLIIKDLLRKVKYFQNFTELELRQLIEIGYRQKLRPESILFREGQPGDAFYIILSGSVEVFAEKVDKHLATLSSGQFFGELALMLGIPRTASVRALEDTVLFAINHKGFSRLLQQHPELAEEIIQELGKHQEELAERQKQLKEMGLIDRAEDDKNPVIWMRKRLKNLFGLSSKNY